MGVFVEGALVRTWWWFTSGPQDHTAPPPWPPVFKIILYVTFLVVPVAQCPSQPSRSACRGSALRSWSSPSPLQSRRAKHWASGYPMVRPGRDFCRDEGEILKSSSALLCRDATVQLSPPETVTLAAWCPPGAGTEHTCSSHQSQPVTASLAGDVSGPAATGENQFWECCSRHWTVCLRGKGQLCWSQPLHFNHQCQDQADLLLWRFLCLTPWGLTNYLSDVDTGGGGGGGGSASQEPVYIGWDKDLLLAPVTVSCPQPLGLAPK